MMTSGRGHSTAAQATRLAAAVVGLIILGCAPPPRGRGPAEPARYPYALFMTARGWGPDEKSAIKEARDELSRMISVQIQNEFHTVIESEIRDTLAKNLSYMKDETVAFTRNDLFATSVAEAWYDHEKEMHGVVLTLDRSVAADRYVAEIQWALEQSARLFDSAAQRQQEGEYAVALQDDVEALRRIQRAVKLQLAGMIVSPPMSARFRDMIRAPALAGIKEHIRALLAEIRLSKAAGDHQRTLPGYGLATPLHLQVLAGAQGKPVAGLPIRFSLAEGTGKLQEQAVTNAGGTAECHVEEVPGSVGAAGAVVAAVDVASMGEGADLSGITPPQERFTFYLPTKANSYFAVYANDAVASDAVKDCLSGRGFQLVEAVKVLQLAQRHGLGTDADEEALLEAFAELQGHLGSKGFLFIVAGTIRPAGSEATVTDFGTLHIARASYTLRLVDVSPPAENRTVLLVTGQAKEGCTDDAREAARRARAAAGLEACEDLLTGLRDRLSR